MTQSLIPSVKHWLRQLPPRETIIHGLFWALFFSMVNADFASNWFDRSLRPGQLAPTTLLFFPLFFYLNALWLLPRYLRRTHWYRYLLYCPALILLAEGMRIAGHLIWGPEAAAPAQLLVQELSSTDSLLLGTFNPALVVLTLSTTYRFTRDWFLNQHQIARLQAEKAQVELHLLRSQVDPHFLFNSLNTLDGLIAKDPHKAQEYLHRLAQIYRYLTAHRDEDFVSLAAEWQFAQDYIYLLQVRFGPAYAFEVEQQAMSLHAYVVPPASLQLVLENVVKHNQGHPDAPLPVLLRLSPKGIELSHPKRAKRQAKVVRGTGMGLNNLLQRYQLLSDERPEIRDQDTFYVRLPLINQLSY